MLPPAVGNSIARPIRQGSRSSGFPRDYETPARVDTEPSSEVLTGQFQSQESVGILKLARSDRGGRERAVSKNGEGSIKNLGWEGRREREGEERNGS